MNIFKKLLTLWVWLVVIVNNRVNKFWEQVRAQAVTRFREGEDSRFRGVLLVTHTVCAIGGVPALITGMALLHRGDILNEKAIIGPEEAFSKALNDTNQTILYA